MPRDVVEPQPDVPVADVLRNVLLVSASAIFLATFAVIAHSLPRTMPLTHERLLVGLVPYFVAPFGVLALHMLVHRGSMVRRLAVGLVTMLPTCSIAILLSNFFVFSPR